MLSILDFRQHPSPLKFTILPSDLWRRREYLNLARNNPVLIPR